MRRKKRQNNRRWVILISLMLVLLMGIVALALSLDDQDANVSLQKKLDTTGQVELEPLPDSSASAEPVKTEETTAAPKHSEKSSDKATFAVVGDVLIHQSLINAGEKADGTYDFAPLFRHTSEIIEAADYAAFDMEGTFRGAPYSGYPSFSTPEDLRIALKGAGFDLGVTSNNHAMDFGIEALRRTVQVLREGGMETLGTRSEAEDPKFLIKEIKGMKIGLTAFTYESERGGALGTNRTLNQAPIPQDMEHLVDSVYVGADRPDLMEEDGKRVKARIEEMRKAGAEAILVYFHWGTEYAEAEDAGQIFYSQLLADLKVEAVVSCGPHVIQPIRSITSQDGSHEMLCYYSLGNFVSNQQFETGNSQGRAQDGLIGLLSFARNEAGRVVLSDCGYVPVFVYKQYPRGKDVEFTDAVVLPIRDALEQPEVYGLDEAALTELRDALDRIHAVMERNNPEEFSLQEYRAYFTP